MQQEAKLSDLHPSNTTGLQNHVTGHVIRMVSYDVIPPHDPGHVTGHIVGMVLYTCMYTGDYTNALQLKRSKLGEFHFLSPRWGKQGSSEMNQPIDVR